MTKPTKEEIMSTEIVEMMVTYKKHNLSRWYHIKGKGYRRCGFVKVVGYDQVMEMVDDEDMSIELRDTTTNIPEHMW